MYVQWGLLACPQGRVATLQSLSGTGSLRVGAAFLHKFLPDATIYLPNPTWGNHKNVFTDAGCEIAYYRHFDPATIGLDFAGLMEDLEAAPDGSVIVLHGERESAGCRQSHDSGLV